MPRADGPFHIIEKYGDNAYKVDLPEQYEASPIFNIGDLRPYYDASELGTIRAEEGGNAPKPSICEQDTNNVIIKNNNYKDTNNEVDQLSSTAQANMEIEVNEQLFNCMNIHGLHRKRACIVLYLEKTC